MNTVNTTAAPSRIRDARLAARLSQQEIAQRANCSISSVQLLEGGYMPVQSDVLPRILAVLNLPQE